MEPLLMLVTIVALILGAAMSMVAWKLLRHQRDHSAARVEALQAMASAEEADDDDRFEAAIPAQARVVIDASPVAARALRAPEASAPARFADLDDAPIDRGGPVAPTSEPAWDAMRANALRAARPAPQIAVRFGGVDEPRAPGRRWIALAGVAALMAAGFGTVYAAYATDLFAAVGRATTASASNTPAAGAEPLQLLSLKHATDESGTFVLTGLVQNPSSGRPLRGVVAVVYLFDQQGRYFAGGKTALDVASIHPGEDSPFVVRVSGAAGVTRYRIGFRMDDGGVVAHVDRRGEPPGGTVEDATEADHDGPQARPLLPRRSEG